MKTFVHNGENWVVTNETSTDIFAKRPGKRGRPSKFKASDLQAAGVVFTVTAEPVTPVETVQPEVQDAPVVNEDTPAPAKQTNFLDEIPF